MAKPSFLNRVVTALLAFVTTALVCGIIASLFIRSSAKPVRVGRAMDAGWPFIILAMDGDQIVELEHEWFGCGTHRIDALGAAASDSRSDPQTRQTKRKSWDHVVWADTGKANKSLRYYLTKTDLLQANSQLDSSEPSSYRDVKVEVLKDDPVKKHQTLKVTLQDEENDVVNIYKVDDGRVTPLAWSRCRPGRTGAFIVMLTWLPIFVASCFLWRDLLRGRI